MKTPNQNGYLLPSHGDEWHKALSLEELQAVVNQNKAWHELLAAQGKIKGGPALVRAGVTVAGNNGPVVSDGPYVETKEAIGGTLWLDVATHEEAIAIARTNPSLAFNTSLEIRPVAEECSFTLAPGNWQRN